MTSESCGVVGQLARPSFSTVDLPKPQGKGGLIDPNIDHPANQTSPVLVMHCLLLLMDSIITMIYGICVCFAEDCTSLQFQSLL